MSSESLGQAVANNTNWINSVISNSKLSSQLAELSSIDSLDQKIVVQEGELDAKYANAKTIRGYKGNWEADTNNPILSDNSGVVGDIYKVSIGGNIDIGSGSIDYVAGDLIYLSEDNWIKISPNQISDITGLQLALDALADGLIPQGTWDALLNDPDIDGGIAETGYFWIVSVAGTTDVGGITDWEINDWAVKTATGWAKIDNTDKVLSVAGRTGVIVLSITDITGLTTALANCVKLTGDQSIAGKKTFTEDLTATANQDIRGNLTIGTLRSTENESYAINVLDTNSIIAFGDNTLPTQNVMVGEYGTTDTDQLWLHGKNGTFFSHDGDANEAISIAMNISDEGRIGMGTPASGLHKLSVLGNTSLNGNVYLQDNNNIYIGNAGDLQIYHDGSSSYIKDTGTGDLRIWADSPNISTLSGNKIFYGNNGAAELYYTGGSKRFVTTNSGIKVGNNDVDEADWLQISKTANNARITNTTRNFLIQQSSGSVQINKGLSENMAEFIVDGEVNLYHNGSRKLQTAINGVEVWGLDGSTPYLTIENRSTGNEVEGNVFGGMAVVSNKLPNAGVKAQAQFITGLSRDGTNLGAAFQVNVNQAGTVAEAFRVNVGGDVGIGTPQPETKLHILDNNAEVRIEHKNGATGFARVFTGTNNGLKLGAGSNGEAVVEITGDNRIMSLFGTLTFNNQSASYTGNQNYTYRIRPNSEGTNILNPSLLFTKQDPNFGTELIYMQILGDAGDAPDVRILTNFYVETTNTFLAKSDDASSKVIAMIDSTGGIDNGGLAIKTGDNNNDESALYILNYLNSPVFRVKATNGDVITSGDIETTSTTSGLILVSPNGTRWRQTISNTGVPIYTQA